MKRVLAVIGIVAALTGEAMAGQFDSAVWKSQANDLTSANTRYAQLDAALALMQPGLARSEVANLLGPPDDDLGSEWVYYMGPSFAWEMHLLVVKFEGDRLLDAALGNTETYVGPPR